MGRPGIGQVLMPGRLTLGAARRIALAAQGIGAPRPAAVTMRQVQAQIDRVAQFQIDSVNVAVRAHYMPLFSRLGPYDVRLLHRASDQAPRRLFEYWGHAACLIDASLHPALRWRMERNREKGAAQIAALVADKPALAAQILAQIREHGALAARAVSEEENRVRDHWGWNWSQAKHVLEYLFGAGELSVAHRNTAFERCYDLTEQVLPASVLDAEPLGPQEAHDVLVGRAARALGVADAEALGAYFFLNRADARASIARLEASGALQPVQVEGLSAPHWLWHEARKPRHGHAQALVSPFDSLVFERGRLERLFGTRYRIEIYVPAAKREFGYYVYLFFFGDAPAARVDLKADRAHGVLRVRSAWVEPGSDAPATARALAAELHAMAGWLGLKEVAVEPLGSLAAVLAPLV